MMACRASPRVARRCDESAAMTILPLVTILALLAAAADAGPQVDPRVSAVKRVGPWSSGSSAGEVRVVVVQPGATAVGDAQLWLDWVEQPAAGSPGPGRVLKSVQVKELSGKGMNLIAPEVIRVKPDLMIRFTRTKPTRHTMLLSIKGVGSYACLGCD